MRLRKIAAAVMAVFMTAGYMPAAADDTIENTVPQPAQSEEEVAAEAQEDKAEVAESDPAEMAEEMPEETQTYMGITMEDQEEMQDQDEDTSVWDSLLSSISLKADAASNSPRSSSYTTIYGIDVSSYQKDIDWAQVDNDGVDFAIIRAGGRGYGTGQLFADPYYQTNLENAKAQGLPVGVYFFSQAISEDEAVAEADYVCELVEGYSLDLPIFMDYEYTTGYRLNNGASVSERTAVITAFCEEVLAHGYETGVYGSAYQATNAFDGAGLAEDYYMWIAAYPQKYSDGISYYDGIYDYWQYTSSGSVLGIDGNVDVDTWFKTSVLPAKEFASGYMYRLYNKGTGEHFYSASGGEAKLLIKAGWRYEGQAWKLPSSKSIPVYRLYNKYAGEHHYTTSAAEKDMLAAQGWSYEGIGWYSDPDESVPLYRLYNPNAYSNNHFYTTSSAEKRQLIKLGWEDEGIGWYGA